MPIFSKARKYRWDIAQNKKNGVGEIEEKKSDNRNDDIEFGFSKIAELKSFVTKSRSERRSHKFLSTSSGIRL